MSEDVHTTLGQLVAARDGYCCVRCARSIWGIMASCHHRKLRSGGGPDACFNRITLCGSGTTGCHGWVHSHPLTAMEEANGWIVSRYVPDGEIPSRLVLCKRRGPILLDDGYGWKAAA